MLKDIAMFLGCWMREFVSLCRRARQQFLCRCRAGTGVGGTEASWQFMGCLIASAESWEIRGWFRRVWLLGNVHWKWLKSKLRVSNVADPRSRAELRDFEMPKRGTFFVVNVNERSWKLMCLGVQILQRSSRSTLKSATGARSNDLTAYSSPTANRNRFLTSGCRKNLSSWWQNPTQSLP